VKENIEEDIINAQHFINSIKTDKDYKDENGWHGYYNKEILELARILDHILSDYKKILKENEELKKSKITYEKVRDIQEKNKNIVDNNYIPKQKIKDKIEEINKMIAYEHNDAVIIQLGKQKRVLQKLLGSEE
jgi:hypothetical protein